MSLVSIIIPTYNRANLLIQSVESCLNQNYRSIEIIIIDDGSTDNTEWIVRDLLRSVWKNKPVSYHKQKNSGASAARNKGIELSKGDYIQFLDSDDLLHPEKLELQINSMEKDQNFLPDICSCYGFLGDSFFDEQIIRIGVKCTTAEEYIFTLVSKIVHGMQTSAPLWKSSFLKSQSGWREDINLGDDLEYHIRLLTKAKQVSFVDKELFLVRIHEGERLSVVQQDKKKIISSVLTKQAIFETIRNAHLWNGKMQKIFLSSLSATYANVLTFYSKKEIVDFENWLWKLSFKPKIVVFFLFVIPVRKILGRRVILLIHKFTMNFK